MSDEPWDLLIGAITAPHGLHGAVRVRPFTDDPERFAHLKQVGLRRGGVVQPVTVRRAHINGMKVTLELAGVETIDAAETLRGVELVIPRAWARPLDADTYYYHQLIGLEVVTTDGEALGPITAIHETGANDVYETPLALIPAVKSFVRQVDLAAGRMVVLAMPGLKKDER